MKRTVCIVTLCAALAASTTAVAQTKEPAYHPKDEITVTGKVTSVKTIPDWMGKDGVNLALEGPEADLVQLRQHDERDAAALERDLERLLRPCEPRRDAEVDPAADERPRERDRLLDAVRCEPCSGRDRADGVLDIGVGLRVPGEEQRPQKSTLR